MVSEAYHAGWKAAVDGAEQSVLRTDGDFMGLGLEPGRHEITLRFEPESVVIGGWISLVSAVLVGAALLATRGTGSAPGIDFRLPPETPM